MRSAGAKLLYLCYVAGTAHTRPKDASAIQLLHVRTLRPRNADQLLQAVSNALHGLAQPLWPELYVPGCHVSFPIFLAKITIVGGKLER